MRMSGQKGFEGWYFKHQKGDDMVAFIPGRAAQYGSPGSKTNIGPPVSYRYRRSDPTPEIVGHLLERSVG